MEERKKDHIALTKESQVSKNSLLKDFYYEAFLGRHPGEEEMLREFTFAGKTMRFPLWISSMTGGTERAGKINRNLAKACAEFGLGMGLGSCRILLEDETRIADFTLRDIIGEEAPIYMNLGIAQIRSLLNSGETDRILQLQSKLACDGLIIHVNPLQEWVQEEGDHISVPPIHTIKEFLGTCKIPLIVKEVGQGFGPESMKALMQLPLSAIAFASAGGTNFAKLEAKRKSLARQEPLALLGQTAEEMTEFCNSIAASGTHNVKEVIISGGIKTYLDGFKLVKKCALKSVYGMASALLSRAEGEYEDLADYIKGEIMAYRLAEQFLRLKEKEQ